MKKNVVILRTISKLSILFIILILSIKIATAQKNFYLNTERSTITVKGTSSLHNWEMNAKQVESSLNAIIENNELTELSNVVFDCKVKGLVSKDKDMDKKAHKALLAEKNPTIKFNMLKMDKLESKNGILTGVISGNLRIAGKTNKISFPFKGKIVANTLISIEAVYKIDMLNYDIEPPTAMLGMLKTGNDVTVNLLLNYIQK